MEDDPTKRAQCKLNIYNPSNEETTSNNSAESCTSVTASKAPFDGNKPIERSMSDATFLRQGLDVYYPKQLEGRTLSYSHLGEVQMAGESKKSPVSERTTVYEDLSTLGDEDEEKGMLVDNRAKSLRLKLNTPGLETISQDELEKL